MRLVRLALRSPHYPVRRRPAPPDAWLPWSVTLESLTDPPSIKSPPPIAPSVLAGLADPPSITRPLKSTDSGDVPTISKTRLRLPALIAGVVVANSSSPKN